MGRHVLGEESALQHLPVKYDGCSHWQFRCKPYILLGLTSPSGGLTHMSEAQVEMMLKSQIPSHVILCPSNKPERLLCCEQRRAQLGGVWEQAQEVRKFVGYSTLTIPETTKSLSAFRHRAARALLLVVSKGSDLKFNLQKGQGT